MPHNPHADFTPTLKGYSGQEPFRFWCQLALPLTYDDSLSYYELLNKVVSYLNHTIEDVSNMESNVGELHEAYVQLQNYVNDYFDNIDIEDELKNVLDKMALDGSLDALLDPLVANHLPEIVESQIDDVVAEQIDGSVERQIGGVIAEQLPPLVDENIPDEVSGWLEENVDPVGSAVIVDSSLTISGAAADAKATGDELSELKTQLGAEIDLSSITWSVGSVKSDGTIQTSDTSTDLASDYISVYDNTKIRFKNVDLRGPNRSIAGYDSNRNFVQVIIKGDVPLYPDLATTVEADIPSNVAYVRVTRHNSIENTYMHYVGVTDSAFNKIDDLKESLIDNRTISKFTVPAKFVPSGSAFDPSVDMPNNTWWAGAYSVVKSALTTGNLSGYPVPLNDNDTIRIEKYEQIGSNSRLYIVYNTTALCVCVVNYSGTIHTWRRYTHENNTLFNSGTIITADNKENYFTDADNAPVNKWFEIQAGAHIENTPYGDGGTSAAGVYTEGVRSFAGWLNGTLYTFKTTNGTLINQIFISSAKHKSAATSPTILYYRCKYTEGLWGAWSKVSDKASPTASNIAIRKKMIAPYLDGDGNPTATDTGTPNPQYMADDPLIFNDFNNAPMNSIYQIDLDCDSSVMFNNPKPGVSSILITTGFSYINRHGQVQFCIGIKTGGAFAYLRYGYQQAVNDYRWTAWTDLTGSAEIDTSNFIKNKGTLANNSDLDSINTNSVYFLSDNNTYSHMPSDMSTYGFITTKIVGVIIQQTIETGDSIYIRRYNSANWSAWVKK